MLAMSSQAEDYAIVVDAGRAEPVCFIATPFAASFNHLSTLVKEAANRMRLQSIRTDSIQGGPDVAQDIMNRIRSAEMVVAALIPEDPADKAGALNANVMYELGMAHALGKPTIIITTHKDYIPADLKLKYHVLYDPKKDDESNIATISLKMQGILERTQRSLVDPDWPGVTLYGYKHRLCLHPEFWDGLRTIYVPIDEVHTCFLTASFKFEQLKTEAEFIVGEAPEYETRRMEHLEKLEQDYRHHHSNFVSPLISTDGIFKGNYLIENTFKQLREMGDLYKTKYIEKPYSFYNHMICAIKDYSRLYNKIFSDRVFSGDLKEQVSRGEDETARNSCSNIHRMWLCTVNSMVNAHMINKNLMAGLFA